MEGKIDYFDIKEFNFCHRGKQTIAFSSQQEIMDNFFDWINSRPNLDNTRTVKADKTEGQVNVYCLDKDSMDGDYVFVLWNEMSSNDGDVLAVSKTSTVGKVDVQPGFNSDTQIPGLPSYYWVSLKNQFVATIYFDHGTVSIANFKNYLTNYIYNYSGYAVRDKNDRVIGLKQNKESPLSSFKFELTRSMDESSVERLIQNYSRINKLVKRSKIEATDPMDSAFLIRKAKGLAEKFMKKSLNRNKETCLYFELDFNVSSLADMKEIISDYGDTINEAERLNDFGFKLKGESKLIYLSGESLRKIHSFDIIRERRNPFTANQILNHIRNNLIKLNIETKGIGVKVA